MPTIDMSDCPCCGASSGSSQSPAACCEFDSVPSISLSIVGTGTCNIYSNSISLGTDWEAAFDPPNLCMITAALSCADGQYTLTLGFVAVDNHGSDLAELEIPMTLLSCDPLHLVGESGGLIITDTIDGDAPECECEGTLQVEITE